MRYLLVFIFLTTLVSAQTTETKSYEQDLVQENSENKTNERIYSCRGVPSIKSQDFPKGELLLEKPKELNYEHYHQQIIAAEHHLAAQEFEKALQIYDGLFESYHFIFLKEYQIAAQLAIQTNDSVKTQKYIKKGIQSGWTLQSIRKNKLVKNNLSQKEWLFLKKNYSAFRKSYESKLNQTLKKQAHQLFKRDQKKALGALFTFSSNGQDRYAENKFAPHSEKQLAAIKTILESQGYPGEQLIGNTWWVSTVLSHHNSISTQYNKKDTLYPVIKPLLHRAFQKGQISPYEMALIDDWYLTVKYNRQQTGYGIINPPSSPETIKETNQLRKKIYFRPIELRTQLKTIETQSGMNFYLEDLW